MKLALGYIPFFWSAEQVNDFYRSMAGQPLDVIYLGEAVCSKRRALRTAEWIELARELATADRQVVLTSLALIEARSELATLKRLCDNGELMIEANDMAGVTLMKERGLPFVAGQGLNIYNAYSLRQLVGCGMARWVFPVELSGRCLQDVLADARDLGFAGRFETEVLAYGHLGLAYSARCFTARAHEVAKDQCGFVCKDFPAGMSLFTQEDQRLFTLNGIQVMSGEVCNLLAEVPEMARIGVDVVRVNPTGEDMTPVISRFRSAVDGHPVDATGTDEGVNGYWHGRPGMEHTLPFEEAALE